MREARNQVPAKVLAQVAGGLLGGVPGGLRTGDVGCMQKRPRSPGHGARARLAAIVLFKVRVTIRSGCTRLGSAPTVRACLQQVQVVGGGGGAWGDALLVAAGSAAGVCGGGGGVLCPSAPMGCAGRSRATAVYAASCSAWAVPGVAALASNLGSFGACGGPMARAIWG